MRSRDLRAVGPLGVGLRKRGPPGVGSVRGGADCLPDPASIPAAHEVGTGLPRATIPRNPINSDQIELRRTLQPQPEPSSTCWPRDPVYASPREGTGSQDDTTARPAGVRPRIRGRVRFPPASPSASEVRQSTGCQRFVADPVSETGPQGRPGGLAGLGPSGQGAEGSRPGPGRGTGSQYTPPLAKEHASLVL